MRQCKSEQNNYVFQSDLSSERDESLKKKSKKNAATPTDPAKDKSTPQSSSTSREKDKATPKSSPSNEVVDRRITRRMSIEQTPPSRNLRKRKVIK